jgi:hypothetical protein
MTLSMNRVLISPVILLTILFSTLQANAQSIATCKSLSGYTLYHDSLAKRDKNNGFETDKITGSIFTLKQTDNNSFDVLFVDARGSIFSLTQMGGKVQKLRSSEKEITLIHMIGDLFEIYTVYRVGDKTHIDLIQSRGMREMSPKSAILTGDCDFFNPIN